jgi:hypothetical protein
MLLMSLPGCIVLRPGPDKPFLADRVTPPQRLKARSPWYPLDGERVELFSNYCGWDVHSERRVVHTPIGREVEQIVSRADELIIASFFLFDNLHADGPAGDYVNRLADLLIAKKKEHPSMPVVLILDLMHKGWGYRESAVVERLEAAGVDVFYSDRLETRPATRPGVWEAVNHVGREADLASDGLLTLPAEAVGHIPIPVPFTFDGDLFTVGTLANAAYFKANHRKALVVKRGGVYEALTTSWNPHNPSLLHENHAISVTGPLARYIYMVLREDVRKSIELGGRYVSWPDASPQSCQAYLQHRLPPLPESSWRVPLDEAACAGPDAGGAGPEAAFATEEAIEPILMRWLREVGPDDRVRIQMFYLSRVPVVNAILDAAARTRHPIQLLLDPNRTGINYPKDGTPNAQVASYLLERARKENARLEIRWYATNGEQNHAKAMTITNEKSGKYLLTLGSTNWTRKNLAGINLENNIFLRRCPRLNRQFNELFDRLWTNGDEGVRYSVAWDDPRYNYDQHKSRSRWAVQKRRAFIFPVFDVKGRPELMEQEWVHW